MAIVRRRVTRFQASALGKMEALTTILGAGVEFLPSDLKRSRGPSRMHSRRVSGPIQS